MENKTSKFYELNSNYRNSCTMCKISIKWQNMLCTMTHTCKLVLYNTALISASFRPIYKCYVHSSLKQKPCNNSGSCNYLLKHQITCTWFSSKVTRAKTSLLARCFVVGDKPNENSAFHQNDYQERTPRMPERRSHLTSIGVTVRVIPIRRGVKSLCTA